MLPYVNLNGAVLPAGEARLSILDHGLLYGDGLFETMRVADGRGLRAAAHLERLERSARQIELSLPWDRGTLLRAIQETVSANGADEAALRLTVTRGEGPPVPDPSACASPSFFITLRERPVPRTSGITACFAGTHPQTFIPGVKSLSYQPFERARADARRRGFDEALLCAGPQVVEGATTNLFTVADGELLTPPLASGCLPGIGRQGVLEIAVALGIPLRETALAQERLRHCPEIFLTSSVAGVLPVIRLEDRILGDGAPGASTRRLLEAFEEWIRSDPAG